MAVLDPNEIMFKAFEPKVQNRFVMLIDNIPSFMVKNVKAPTFTDNVIKLDHINSYRKIRGKREWDDMTMTLYDPVTPSGAQAVMEWARQGYESVTGRAGYSDFYKNIGQMVVKIRKNKPENAKNIKEAINEIILKKTYFFFIQK